MQHLLLCMRGRYVNAKQDSFVTLHGLTYAADCWGADSKLAGRASTFDAVADIAASRAMFADVNVANNGALSLDEYLGWANSSHGEGKVDEAIAYFHQ